MYLRKREGPYTHSASADDSIAWLATILGEGSETEPCAIVGKPETGLNGFGVEFVLSTDSEKERYEMRNSIRKDIVRGNVVIAVILKSP